MLWDSIRLAVAAGDRAAVFLLATKVEDARGWNVAERAAIACAAVEALVAFGHLEEAHQAAAALDELGKAAAADRDFLAGRLASADGDHQRASDLLRAAAGYFDEVEHRNEAWRARWRLAESLAAMGDLEAGRVELETILSEARDADHPLYMRLASDALLALGFTVPPTSARDRTGLSAPPPGRGRGRVGDPR